MKNQKADIRILLRSADKYAVAFYAKLQGYNLYCGPGLGLRVLGRSYTRNWITLSNTISYPTLLLTNFSIDGEYISNTL